MNIEQIKAQVAEWERLKENLSAAVKAKSLLLSMTYSDMIRDNAPAMFQAVKQLMAENERLHTDVKELKSWQQNAVNVLNAYNKQPE